jgi:hypothetical protein
MSFIDKLPLYFAKSKGVDRLLRFMQYSSRTAETLGLTKRLLTMATQLGLARKVLRFGAPLALALRVIRRVQDDALSLLKCCESVSEVAMMLFVLSDHLLFCHKLGLYKFNCLDSIEFINNWSSFVDSLLSLVVKGIAIAKGNSSFTVKLELATTVLELPVRCRQMTLYFLAEDLMSPWLVHFSGAVTAVLGAMQLWATL